MKVLIKSVLIIHPDGKIEKSPVDILIEKGVISKISKNIGFRKGCRNHRRQWMLRINRMDGYESKFQGPG